MLRRILRLAPAALAALILPLAALAADQATLGADRHKERGVACAGCHGKVKKPTYVESAACLGCHGPAEALSAKTAAVKPENPHASPHWGAQMECAVCHRQHQATVNWCDHCHVYKFRVP